MATTKFVNRARMLTSTTGTGSSITLTTAIAGYFTFAEAGLQDGDVVDYIIEQGADFEIQHDQTYSSSGPSLTRGTPAASKVGGVAGTSKINLSGGAQVAIVGLAKSFDVSTFTEEASPDLTADYAWVHSASGGERRKVLLRRLTGIVAGSAQSTASGSSVTFSGIPSGVNRITVMFDRVSATSNDDFLVQIGTSSGVETTGYDSASSAFTTGVATSSSTSGFVVRNAGGVRLWSGIMIMTRVTGNLWVSTHSMGSGTTPSANTGGGTKELSAELDRVRIVSGANFDNGQINIFWE